MDARGLPWALSAEYRTGSLLALGWAVVSVLCDGTIDEITTDPMLDGSLPDNVANKTKIGGCAQLEIGTSDQRLLFGINTRPQHDKCAVLAAGSGVAQVNEPCVGRSYAELEVNSTYREPGWIEVTRRARRGSARRRVAAQVARRNAPWAIVMRSLDSPISALESCR